jgi:hypothetical protein
VLELRNDPRYGKIVYAIWGHIKDEVNRGTEPCRIAFVLIDASEP